MAQIDIKNCDVYIEDGYDGPGGTPLINIGPGAVNLMAGYTAGTTTMVVDGFVGAVVNGEKFTISTETGTPVHTITAHTETSNNTTSITFTPALAGDVDDDDVITMQYAAGATVMRVDGFSGAVANGDRFTVDGDTDDLVHTITAHTETSSNTTSITFTPALGDIVLDNAAITMLPHSLQVRIGEGNMQWTEKRPIIYVKDRGNLDTVRLGDQEPVEVKMDATWVFLSSLGSDIVPTIEEALKRTGPAAEWTSSSADECEPYAVNIRIDYTPPCSIAGEIYTLHDYRYEDLGHDLKTGQLTMSGKCNVVSSTNVRKT